MSKKYFANCQTLEELKREYKKLAMQYHPDRPNGDLRMMQEINAEYEITFELLKNKHETTTNTESTETASDYMEVINELMNMVGIEIEICGTWIWIGGNTKPYKDILKNLGFMWRSKKTMWSLGEFTGRKHKEWNMDKIRETYGSQRVNTKPTFSLT